MPAKSASLMLVNRPTSQRLAPVYSNNNKPILCLFGDQFVFVCYYAQAQPNF
jgi:hypothetical protein